MQRGNVISQVFPRFINIFAVAVSFLILPFVFGCSSTDNKQDLSREAAEFTHNYFKQECDNVSVYNLEIIEQDFFDDHLLYAASVNLEYSESIRGNTIVSVRENEEPRLLFKQLLVNGVAVIDTGELNKIVSGSNIRINDDEIMEYVRFLFRVFNIEKNPLVYLNEEEFEDSLRDRFEDDEAESILGYMKKTFYPARFMKVADTWILFAFTYDGKTGSVFFWCVEINRNGTIGIIAKAYIKRCEYSDNTLECRSPNPYLVLTAQDHLTRRYTQDTRLDLFQQLHFLVDDRAWIIHGFDDKFDDKDDRYKEKADEIMQALELFRNMGSGRNN